MVLREITSRLIRSPRMYGAFGAYSAANPPDSEPRKYPTPIRLSKSPAA